MWQGPEPQVKAQPVLDLLPDIASIEAQAATAEQDAERGAAQLKLATTVLRSLHTMVLNGQVATDQAAALYARVVAATDRSIADNRGFFVLQSASLGAVLGQWQQALAQLRAVAAGDPVVRPSAMAQMIQICLANGSLVDAWPVFAEFERRAATESPEPIELVGYYRLRCALLTRVGLLDGAARALAAAKAIDLAAPVGRPETERELARRQNLQGLLDGSELDLLLAAERFDDARQVARRLSEEPRAGESLRARGRLGLALAAARQGDDGTARPLLEAIADQQGQVDSYGPRAATELALLALRAGDPTLARDRLAAALRLRLDRLDEPTLVAVAWLCLADVGRGAVPAVALPQLRSALQQRFDWMLAQWDATPAAEGGLAFLQLSVRRDLLAALCSVTLQLTPGPAGVEACLEHLLAAEARGSTARGLGLAPRHFAELRAQLLPPEGLLLAYLPALTVSWVFAVTPTSMVAEPLSSDVHLRRQVRAWRAVAFARPASANDLEQPAAGAVLDWCLPPAVRALVEAHHEVVTVGRELIHNLPFESLPWPGDEGWLGCAKAIWDLPSMTLAAHYAGRQRGATDWDLAVLAAGRVDAADAATFGVAALDLRPADLEAMASAVAAERVTLRPMATREDLLSDQAGSARLVVVLAHGVTDPTRSRPLGLLLDRSPRAPTGAVFADDVTAAPEVLLLGSCGLGGSSARRGDDGGQRLGGAFLRAGSRVVIVGDGDLDLAATEFLVRAIVRELTTGASLAEALRRARLATSAAGPWHHPNYHAQLHLVGLGQENLRLAERPPTVRSWWWAVGGAVVLVVVAGKLLRGRARRPVRRGPPATPASP